MIDPRTTLLVLLALLAVGFAIVWGIMLVRARAAGGSLEPTVRAPTVIDLAIGGGTNFFDTLGVGSFAPTTALFRFLHLVPDRLIPGTLNVGHALPTVAEALIFVAIVEVDPWTLAAMIAAAVAGAWLGAGIVAGWARRRVQIGMGVALLIAAALLANQLVRGAPTGADALALHGRLLWLGVAGNALLGAMMTLGVGLYAPCMILVSLLGMNARAAFPIMMGSCAFLMPIAGLRFAARGAYTPASALGLTLGGIPAVLVAAYVIRSLPLDAIRVLVLCVAALTAIAMLRSALIDREAAPAAATAERIGTLP